MARIESIETRLLNWARWRLTKGSGVLGFAAVNLQKAAIGVREPYAQAPVPTNAIEAGETDDAVSRLPPELRATVWVHYLEQSEVKRIGAPGLHKRARLPPRLGTMAERLGYLCCSKSTYHARIDRAHHALAEHFNARQDRRKAERQRIDSLRDGARP